LSLPLGYAFQFLAVAVPLSGIVLAYSLLPGLWEYVAIFTAALLALPLALGCERWGFKFLLKEHGGDS